MSIMDNQHQHQPNSANMANPAKQGKLAFRTLSVIALAATVPAKPLEQSKLERYSLGKIDLKLKI